MLTTETVAVLRTWCRERKGQPDDPLFPTRRGGPLTPKAVAWLLDKHTATAAGACPSLASKRVTPHVLRHTNAMRLRGENVDIAIYRKAFSRSSAFKRSRSAVVRRSLRVPASASAW